MKAGLTGLIAGVGSNFLFGSGNISAFNMEIPAPVMVGISTGIGSFASDMVSESIIENMDLVQNVKTIEETAIRVGVCGLASSGVLYFSGVPVSNLPQTFLLGGASKLGGDYVYEKAIGGPQSMFPLF